MSRKIFWPNNPIYLTFNVLLTIIVFFLMLHVFKWPILLPLPSFIVVVMSVFFFSQRIIVDDKYIAGPIAYGKRRKRVRIPRDDAEAFFEMGKYGFGNVVIRHKHSSKQILVPYLYFAEFTVKELKYLLHHSHS